MMMKMTSNSFLLSRLFGIIALLVVSTTLVVVVDFVEAGTNEKGLTFLAENKQKDGVVELPSGLQYKVLKKGRGKSHPTVDSPCSCHYEGKLTDGTVFDSSYQRGEPTTFAPNQVIKGWTEAMQLMVAGDKFELYIPSELAYGDRGSPPKIGGGEVLIFQMEILAIMGDTVPALSCTVVFGGDGGDGEPEGCDDRETKYVKKVAGWIESEPTKPANEIKRIRAILGTPMSDDLRDWARRREHILSQFLDKASSSDDVAGSEL